MIKKWKNSEKITNDISEVLILLKLDLDKIPIALDSMNPECLNVILEQNSYIDYII